MTHSNKSSNKLEYSFEAIGTRWSITGDVSHELRKKITQRIKTFDHTYSRFIESGKLRSMTQSIGKYILPEDAQPLFDFYRRLYDISDGFVTPLIGTTMEQAGYDASYSFRPSNITKPPTWEDAMQYDFPHLTIKLPGILDFGAAGKGYLVDILAELLRKNGIDNFCINAGGDIFVGSKSQVIGLENPVDTSEIVGTVSIKNSAICASAGNRRRWGDFHHTINPKTLQSTSNIDAIWVRAKTTMLADGIATALYFVDHSQLQKHFDFEYMIIRDSNIYSSQGFEADLLTV